MRVPLGRLPGGLEPRAAGLARRGGVFRRLLLFGRFGQSHAAGRGSGIEGRASRSGGSGGSDRFLPGGLDRGGERLGEPGVVAGKQAERAEIGPACTIRKNVGGRAAFTTTGQRAE